MSSAEDRDPFASKVEAIVSLLDDENPRVKAACTAAMEELGARSLPYLRAAARDGETPAQRSAARSWAGKWAFEEALIAFAAAQKQGAALLEPGVCVLATLSDPLFEAAYLADELDIHAAVLRVRINRSAPLSRRVDVLARYIHGDLGIMGNTGEFYDPRNSFLNEVLKRKLGIPISIAAIYLLLARRLDLPLQGFSVPAHFLLGYTEEERRVYIDAFHEGQKLRGDQVLQATAAQGFDIDPHRIPPARDVDILVRMTNNLRRILDKEDPWNWLPRIDHFRSILLGTT